MGTRGAFGFHINGIDKIAYNHFDSYPEGLGTFVVKWLKEAMQPDKIKATMAAVERLQLIDEEVPPTPEQIEQLREFADQGVASGQLSDWYVLLRKAQPSESIDSMLKAGYMADSKSFLANSLFCEYAYVVNLDDMTFEVYRGFQKHHHQLGRYVDLPKHRGPGGDKYYPVALVASFKLEDFNKWSDSWIEECFPPEPEE